MIQSTVLLALVMLASAHRAWSARHPLPAALTGATLLYVATASLVHHILLAPATMTGDTSRPDALAAHTLYTVLPAAAALDWLLLTPPARTHLRQATTWMLYPWPTWPSPWPAANSPPATSTPSSTSPGTATAASSPTPSSSASAATPSPSSSWPWTTPAPAPAKPDFVHGPQWAKVNVVAARAATIGV
ncbi:hypothetical protein SHKM778_03350 [Streptomyces sp. KM77-8]|uniref:Uncharacterized protein n=1 Tax=Streptomyces haneummycinicus TaxID=3074435 RepID=A0AAT9H981_9ACTN